MTLNLRTPLQNLLEAVQEGLTKPVARAFIQVGREVAWDFDCEGQLSVRAITARPHYPNGPRTAQCGPIYYEVTLGISVLRCVSTVDDNGIAPRPSVITDEANQMFSDMSEVQSAFTGHLGSTLMREDTWNPQGPQGGLAGGEWSIVVRVPA